MTILTSPAIIDSAGTEISYLDSGIPAGSGTYTTLVVIHGLSYTNNSFKGFMALAPSNVRVIAPNRRGYGESTSYTTGDLLVLSKDIITGNAFDPMAMTITNFLLWIVKNLYVPKLSVDRSEGGISLLGWSMGAIDLVAMLAKGNAVTKETKNTLNQYLKAVIFHDPPYADFGHTEPHPKPHTPPMTQFIEYTCSNYINKIPTNTIDDLADQSSIAVKEAYKARIPELIGGGGVQNPPASDMLCFSPFATILWARQADAALFDLGHGDVMEWPHVEVKYFYCTESINFCVISEIETRKRLLKAKEEGKKVRNIEFFALEGQNHAVHFLEPEILWNVVKKAIRLEGAGQP